MSKVVTIPAATPFVLEAGKYIFLDATADLLASDGTVISVMDDDTYQEDLPRGTYSLTAETQVMGDYTPRLQQPAKLPPLVITVQPQTHFVADGTVSTQFSVTLQDDTDVTYEWTRIESNGARTVAGGNSASLTQDLSAITKPFSCLWMVKMTRTDGAVTVSNSAAVKVQPQ